MPTASDATVTNGKATRPEYITCVKGRTVANALLVSCLYTSFIFILDWYAHDYECTALLNTSYFTSP